MDERHVPSAGLRYWVVLLVASIFCAHLGDIIAAHSAWSLLTRMVLLAAVLAAVFICERYDRSSTDAWYWLAVIVIGAGGMKLADFSTTELGIGRLEVIASLVVMLVTTFVVARSDETRLFSTMQLERPGMAAKPMADVAHWLAMIVASTLGAVAGDFLNLALGLGPFLASAILGALLAGIFCLHRVEKVNRLMVFWLAIVAVRAVGVTLGDCLARDPHQHARLLLSTVATGVLVAALVFLRRGPQPRGRDR